MDKTTDQDSVDQAEKIIDQIGDGWLREQLRCGVVRRDFAKVAANIAEDRYGAGSTAARSALAIHLMHGLEMAEAFAADLEHHER